MFIWVADQNSLYACEAQQYVCEEQLTACFTDKLIVWVNTVRCMDTVQ